MISKWQGHYWRKRQSRSFSWTCTKIRILNHVLLVILTAFILWLLMHDDVHYCGFYDAWEAIKAIGHKNRTFLCSFGFNVSSSCTCCTYWGQNASHTFAMCSHLLLRIKASKGPSLRNIYKENVLFLKITIKSNQKHNLMDCECRFYGFLANTQE